VISGTDPCKPGQALERVRVGDEVLAERLRRMKAVLAEKTSYLAAAGRSPERDRWSGA
jgi:hypothetical protein